VKILQLTSDWKWTGPAEPMLLLARILRERGHAVELACPEAPAPDLRSLAGEARQLGVKPALMLERARGLRPLRDRAEVQRLHAFLREQRFDIVHTWHTRDHLLALRAAGLSERRRLAAVVRSYRKAERIARWPWNRWLFGPGCDGLVCVSPRTAEWNRALRGGRPLAGVFGAVDLVRFAPAHLRGLALLPNEECGIEPPHALGLLPEQRVVGIVARVQRERRFDLLLAAAVHLFREDPQARLLIVGRGTHRAEVAELPAQRLDIADRVVFAGYRTQDYADVLRSIDVFTYLVPGSDGTCRALLEAAACGIPAVVTPRGALPEIVLDGETGLVVPEEPEALARAWRALLEDSEQRRRLGESARARAQAEFSPPRFADAVEAIYREVLRAR